MVSPTKSILAFTDCASIFDRAQQTKKGIYIECPSHGHAVSLRTRLHTYRKLDRKHLMRVYQPDDPKYGHSPHDVFIIRIAKKGTEDDHIVRIERPDPNIGDLKIGEIVDSEPPASEPREPDVDQLMRDLTGKTE